MTEERYFSVDYDEEYYIFDSTKISEEEVLEKAEYSYDVFGESLTPQEHLDLLNENEQLKKEINRLYNYFEDWYNDMTSANDFSEIWDNVKEDERWD